MAFIGGFNGFPVGQGFTPQPVQFLPPAVQIQPLNLQPLSFVPAAPQQQVPVQQFQPAFTPTLTQMPTFGQNPLLGGPSFSGGASLGNSMSPTQAAMLGMFNAQPQASPFEVPSMLGGTGGLGGSTGFGGVNPNSDPSSFMNNMVGMQFQMGNIMNDAMGAAMSMGSPGAGLVNINQLGQQFQQVYGNMQNQESQFAQTALDNYNKIKDSIFSTNHYEFDANGNPHVVTGAETPAQQAQRLDWEQKQQAAVDQSFNNNPLNATIQQLSQEAQTALQNGQNPKQLYLQIDQLTTQMNLAHEQASLQATGIPITSDMPKDAADGAQALAQFAQTSLSNYAQMHASNMQSLANNPITDEYLNAMISQASGYQTASNTMQNARQQIMGILQGGLGA